MLQTTHAPVMPYSNMMKDDARWALLMQTYDCPKHGQNESECQDYWTADCNQAKYGFACPACGYIGTDSPTSKDEAHDALCCGRMICDAPFCYTHDNF